MPSSIIRVENLSKRYRIGLKENQPETLVGQLSHAIISPWRNLKRLRRLNQFAIQDDSEFWALKNISFEVKEGEVLGIIGKNGAGKSTLLKILSQITEPTSGKIELTGRVASLLEVGTGFHPELSGRDNIYMNGTILGMTRKEIDSKVDEIIDFSGVERFIDTPVKFYSSGMKVRLGFSVAAHLNPEILIIDEVLAVGDYEFQKKCLGKMEDVSKNQGRTVLFVSHNLMAVKNLCTKGILLETGRIISSGDISKVSSDYLGLGQKNNRWTLQNIESDPCIVGVEVRVVGMQPNLRLNVITEVFNKHAVSKKAFLAFYIGGIDSVPLMEAIPDFGFIDFSLGNIKYKIETEIEINGIIPGNYSLGVWMGFEHTHQLDWKKEIVNFEIVDPPIPGRKVAYPKHSGSFVPKSRVIDCAIN